MVFSTLRLKNQLLSSLPDAEWPYWHPLLEAVDLPAGKLLYESGSSIHHVYFPLTAVVSLYHVTESGATMVAQGQGICAPRGTGLPPVVDLSR